MIRHLQYDRARLTQVSARLAARVWAETIRPDELVVAGPVDRITLREAQQLAYRPFELGERCELAAFDPDAWRRYHDFEALRTLESADGVDPAWSGELRAELARYCDTFDDGILARLHEHTNATRAHEIFALGHAHIDTAW